MIQPGRSRLARSVAGHRPRSEDAQAGPTTPATDRLITKLDRGDTPRHEKEPTPRKTEDPD
jgi:hypothetical protein